MQFSYFSISNLSNIFICNIYREDVILFVHLFFLFFREWLLKRVIFTLIILIKIIYDRNVF